MGASWVIGILPRIIAWNIPRFGRDSEACDIRKTTVLGILKTADVEVKPGVNCRN